MFGLSAEERREVRVASMHPSMAMKQQALAQQIQKECDEQKRRVKRGLEAQKNHRDALYKQKMDTIKSTQQNFITKLDEFLEMQLAKQHQARKEMYGLWVTEVHEKANQQVKKQMQHMSAEELSNRLNTLFESYLEAAEKKTIYRDVIIESEYDPMEAKKHILKLDMGKRAMFNPDGIKDPLCEQIDKVNEVHSGGAHLPQNQKCPGRQCLSLHEWATGQIEATPHGFANMFFLKSIQEMDLTQEEKALRNKKNMSHNVKSGVMDHYDIARGPEAVNSEYPRGKRVGYVKGDGAAPNVFNPKAAHDTEPNPIGSPDGPLSK